MVKMVISLAVAVTALTLTSAPTHAADGRDAFEKGSRYFKAEEYEAALPHFQRAYTLSGHRPAAVFALAQCERALKIYAPAIDHFREYLRSDPPNAADVEETIALLVELLDRQNKEQRAATAARRAERAERARQQAEAERRADAAVLAKREAQARARREAEARRQAEAKLRRLELEAQAPPPPPAPALPAAAPPPPDDDGGSIWQSPWFWAITGAVAAGGAVTAAVLVSQSSSSDPYAGTTGVTLRP